MGRAFVSFALILSQCLLPAWASACLDTGLCEKPDLPHLVEPLLLEDAVKDREEALRLLQIGARKAALSSERQTEDDGQRAAARGAGEDDVCEVGAAVQCPGSEATCAGSQCCPGIPETMNQTFPCPSAPLGFAGCSTTTRVASCVPCLCSFDLDRTLTGKQGAAEGCPENDELPVQDWAYGGGNLTLSPAGQALGSTFCGEHKCYLAVVTAGDGSGYRSKERRLFEQRLEESGGRLVSSEWSGPSKLGEARANCSGVELNSTLVAGCSDATKQFALEAVVEWLEQTQHVKLPRESVWHFDDKDSNVLPFKGTGFNAREVSCATRDGNKGFCGATVSEIADEPGVVLCES